MSWDTEGGGCVYGAGLGGCVGWCLYGIKGQRMGLEVGISRGVRSQRLGTGSKGSGR